MSEAAKTQEPGPVQTTPDAAAANVEVDKSIPEPVVAEQSTSESTPIPEAPAEVTATTAVTATEGSSSEKPKETEKPDDLARSILKGFQNKLAGVFPKKSEKASEPKEEKKEVSADAKEDIKEEEKETKEPKERRSASRKRNSFFGGLVLGKKEEKSEVEETAVTDANKDVASEPKQSAEVVSDQPLTSETPATTDAPNEKPAGPFKRASIFGTLKSQFARKEKAETSATSKEAETSTATAPVIPAVGTSDTPVKEEIVSEAVVEKAQEIQSTVEAKAEKLATKAERRKSTLPFGLGLSKKEKLASSDDEAYEKPLSPFARIRATVRSKTSPKHAPEKKEEPPTTAEIKPEEVVSQPIISEPEPAVTTASPTVAASA